MTSKDAPHCLCGRNTWLMTAPPHQTRSGVPCVDFSCGGCGRTAVSLPFGGIFVIETFADTGVVDVGRYVDEVIIPAYQDFQEEVAAIRSVRLNRKKMRLIRSFGGRGYDELVEQGLSAEAKKFEAELTVYKHSDEYLVPTGLDRTMPKNISPDITLLVLKKHESGLSFWKAVAHYDTVTDLTFAKEGA